MKEKKDYLEEAARHIISEIGEDHGREGLIKTPARYAKALREITCGYGVDLDKLFNNAYFTVAANDIVLVKDITFYSLCEHHLLPFFGKVHVAYIPNGKIVGLSKIPRLVHAFAARLQVQERFTRQIADTLLERLNPFGVAVIVEARHMCMEMRGAKTENSCAKTSAMLGVFRKDTAARAEVLELLK